MPNNSSDVRPYSGVRRYRPVAAGRPAGQNYPKADVFLNIVASSYFCAHCGSEHPGLPTDWGYKLPDVVDAVSYVDRYRRARHNSDLCTLDETRHFIRGVLPIPINHSDKAFNWGIWVEVDRETHDVYVINFHSDMSTHPRGAGFIANEITPYGETMGLAVAIQYNPDNSRPTFHFPADVVHALALEQRSGITDKRQHDILHELGYFDEAGD
jgi:hypothetical protein